MVEIMQINFNFYVLTYSNYTLQNLSTGKVRRKDTIDMKNFFFDGESKCNIKSPEAKKVSFRYLSCPFSKLYDFFFSQ